MIINVAKSAGFCFGVKRAIKIAFETSKAKHHVYMLGDIVHNEDVVKLIHSIGIKKINALTKGKDKTLLIRAHGASKKIHKKALSLGYEIVDATCPMVKEIHRTAVNAENDGYSIIVIGDKKHSEVLGIVGQLKRKSIVIDNIENLPIKAIKKLKKVAVIVQSTQNIETVLKILKEIRKHIKNVKFFNTICRTTRIKQEDIKKMPRENDIMLIIGSKTSANTKRLYEISKSLNARSYWIQSLKDLKRKWFKDAESVGITAGASTPENTTSSVVEYINKKFVD